MTTDLENLAHTAWKRARRIVVAVVGGTVVLLGLAMTVLPGPAIVVIPAGVGILATEFVWARKLMRRVKRKIKELRTDERKADA